MSPRTDFFVYLLFTLVLAGAVVVRSVLDDTYVALHGIALGVMSMMLVELYRKWRP